MIKDTLLKHLFLFSVGGFLYGLIEIMARGYTHWSMVLLGGLCFILLGILNEFMSWELSITTQMMLGAIMITILEFSFGCLLNLICGWNVWDYSNDPYNFLGQISLKHSCYWLLLSGVGIILDDFLRYWLFKEEKPKYRL